MKFNVIYDRAVQRKSGEKALKILLPNILSQTQLKKISDDRYLSCLTKVVNQSGFNWKVIENKWPDFEAAFFNFDPVKLVGLSPQQWDAYRQDKRVVRNWQKIAATCDNAYFVLQTSDEHGSFGEFLASWPSSDQIGLMDYLKQNGSRLGGKTAQYFLRFIGKDSFLLSTDVIKALQGAGLSIADNPTSKRDYRTIQDQFNQWHEQTNLPYAHLSRIAACSIGEDRSS